MKVLALILVLTVSGLTLARSVEKDKKEVIDLLKKLLQKTGPTGEEGPPGAPGPVGPIGTEDVIEPPGSGSGSGAFGSGIIIEPPIGSGSGDGIDPGLEAFKTFLMEHCKLNFDDWMTEMQTNNSPVDVKEYAAAMRGFSGFARKFSGDISGHEDELEALEGALVDTEQGIGPEEFATQHGDLLSSFLETLGGAMADGVCARMALLPIRLRIDTEGMSGFKNDKKCNNAGVLIWETMESSGWDQDKAAAAVRDNLEEVGKAVRADVKCLIHDIHEFAQSVMAMPTLNLGSISARKATIFMDMAYYHLDDISITVFHIHHNAEVLGRFLGYEDAMEQNAVEGKKRATLMKELGNLQKLLKKFDLKKMMT